MRSRPHDDDASGKHKGKRRWRLWCFTALAVVTAMQRSQACCLVSISAYASIFLSIVNGLVGGGFWTRTETIVRVGKNGDVATTSGPSSSSSSYSQQQQSVDAGKMPNIEWCEFGVEGSLCSTARGGNCTGGGSPKCKWFPKGAPVAVIFSDRLVKSGMVTMTSLCRHPTTLYVLVLMQVTATYKPIPSEFLSCKTISMTMVNGLQYLRDAGWKPDSICDGPGRDELGKVTQPTLLGAAHWDKDPKHASCANHLRFYLTEFPILEVHDRILFVDDDVVIQQDAVKLYRHKTRPGVIFTANCDVNLWNQQCQRFDVGRSVYHHFFSQAVIPDGAWEKVEGLLREASHGTIKYDQQHFEWNFGFNLMSLAVSRQINMSSIYEYLAANMLSKRYIRGDSLVYGLGVPFLAYAGRIECYSRSGWYVLDGLGYVPPAEMEVAGVTSQVITDAPVLHYNGERKPWGTNPFAEYVKAMGYWGQNLTGLPQPKRRVEEVGESKPLTLVVLLSGPRTGTEWLAKVMADDNQLVCGSIDDRTAPHPESLMPYDVACDNATQIPCLSWHIVGPRNDSCDLRYMCQWRYILSAARGVSVTPNGGAADNPSAVYERQWREWGRRRNNTEVFEGYLRRQMRMPTSAPELPCRCEQKQKVLFLKFFLGWLERPVGAKVGLDIPSDYPFLRRYVEPGTELSTLSAEERFYSIDARAVFRRLNARIIYLYREPIAQYLSIQRGRRSELTGSGTAWHCFEVNQSKCPAKPKTADSKMEINIKDAGFFVVEALRLQKLAHSFGPLFSSTFEACVTNATSCVDTIYKTIKLPRRTKSVLAARVSSSLNVVANLDDLMETLQAIKAGNWSSHLQKIGRRERRALRKLSKSEDGDEGTAKAIKRALHVTKAPDGTAAGGPRVQKVREKIKVAPLEKPKRNVSFEAALRKAAKWVGDESEVHVGEARCPRIKLLERPAYPLYAQIHRNRLAGMLVNPKVLGSLSLICVIGSQPEPSQATYGLRGQVSAGDEVWYSTQPYMDTLLQEEFEMPAVLRRIRQEGRKAAGGRRPQVVLYSNPRGSNPTGVDTCTSYRELERSSKAGSGAMSWSEAGVLDEAVGASTNTLVLRPPALLMAGRHNQHKRPICVVAPSHPVAAERSGSVCHVDAFPRPATGWTKGLRNTFYFASFVRVQDETMIVLNATVGKDAKGRAACRVVVKRDAKNAINHEAGQHALAPTHLDAEAAAASCETPVQYAFDYADTAAASCIERHLEHALAVGADGTWLDNMGPNLYGAKTATGVLLGSYDLRYPVESTNPEPCPRELSDANLEATDDLVGDAERERETAIYKFKLCRFSAMIKAQGARVASASAAIHKMLGKKPLVFGNGLKHSFYWTGKEASQVRALYRRYIGAAVNDAEDMRPFAPNASENVIYYKVKGTREMMAKPNGPLDGFNMESFYGFIEVRHQCANWPIAKLEAKHGSKPVTLEACGAELDHPATNFWHANVRVFANAGQRNLRALAKVGQAGWKTVGQEYLLPKQLHKWVMGAYASFLFTVGRTHSLSLGVHPFAQTRDTPDSPPKSVTPWLHPIFYVDIGLPNQTERLIEEYRLPGRSTYARLFDHGIVLYNPEADDDVAIPLGGEYVDPYDVSCKRVHTYARLAGQTGAILVRL